MELSPSLYMWTHVCSSGIYSNSDKKSASSFEWTYAIFVSYSYSQQKKGLRYYYQQELMYQKGTNLLPALYKDQTIKDMPTHHQLLQRRFKIPRGLKINHIKATGTKKKEVVSLSHSSTSLEKKNLGSTSMETNSMAKRCMSKGLKSKIFWQMYN